VVADVTKAGIQKITNDIYVDVIENLIATFNSSGNIINSSINGKVVCKSYIAGNPSFKMRFCDNIVVGQDQSYGIKLDDVSFNPCVNYSDFEFNKTLTFAPPNGTITAMTYRISKDFNYPFKCHSFIDEKSNFKIVLALKVNIISF
jgi:hypothetical protein